MLKARTRLLLSVLLFALAGCGHGRSGAESFALHDGDILFQSLPHNSIVDTIEGSTRSAFSHCGIVHQTDHGWMVIEAIGPVKETALKRWIAQGRGGRYSVYRLQETYRSRIPAIISAAQSYEGRPYDIRYELDDEKIYCSELIYKAFRLITGEELGQLQRLGDLDWRPYKEVIESIENGPAPLDRLMITPRSLAEAKQLILVIKDTRSGGP